MNLSRSADRNTELPFVDVFRLSRRWVSQKKVQPGDVWNSRSS